VEVRHIQSGYFALLGISGIVGSLVGYMHHLIRYCAFHEVFCCPGIARSSGCLPAPSGGYGEKHSLWRDANMQDAGEMSPSANIRLAE
jgi:hypothetical protein